MLRARVRLLKLLLVLVLLVSCTLSCKRQVVTQEAPVAIPVITESATNLLFTWIDDKGEFHRESKVADVPEGSRELVRVLDPEHEPPAGQIFMADLRAAGEGGRYPVRTADRADFEKVAAARRGEKAVASHPPIPRRSTPKRPSTSCWIGSPPTSTSATAGSSRAESMRAVASRASP